MQRRLCNQLIEFLLHGPTVMMKSFVYLTTLLAWWMSAVLATNNNLTDVVEWDHYSLSVNGQR